MRSKSIKLTNNDHFVCTIEIPAAFKALPKQSLVSLFALTYMFPETNEEAGQTIRDVLADWRDEEENKEESDGRVLRRISMVEKWLKEAAQKKHWSIWINKGW